jgi:hypothetical protein
MCPACVATIAVIAAGAPTTGLVALMVKKLRAMKPSRTHSKPDASGINLQKK